MLLLLPFTLLFTVVLPLLRMLVALPFAVARSLFSDTRWIEAETRWPVEETIRWRTTAARAAGAADDVVAALAHGHEVVVAGAVREWATEPRDFR